MSNEIIKESKKKLNEIQSDEQERELAWLREKYILDSKTFKDTGFDEGFDKGSKAKAIEVAKKMKEANKSVDEIAKFTGLSKDELDKI